MSLYLWIAVLLLDTVFSCCFWTLTFSLRDFSRAKLAEYLGRHDADRWFETLTERTEQYIFVTAFLGVVVNLLVWTSLLEILRMIGPAIVLSLVISLFTCVVVPQVLAKYVAEPAMGFSAPLLNLLRIVLTPLTRIMAFFDRKVRSALGVREEVEHEEIEQEILSAMEEGEKEGVMDVQERELIENVIEFRDTTAGHIMTARTEIVALELTAGLNETRATIEKEGYSRLPVYEETLDKIAGILYARDLIKFLGQSDQAFDMRSILRPAMFVPETKPLRHLLNDFRQQKVHLAIVLDEYGGTAGLVTIEDVLEELVGEISDEHEAMEPAMFRKIGELFAEADARLTVDELNRKLGLELPLDAGYETIGGFLMANLGRIPEKGAVAEFGPARFTVLEAQPQKVNRVRIDLIPVQKARQAG
jgi:CBS domain containing-hemolysin-like protein